MNQLVMPKSVTQDADRSFIEQATERLLQDLACLTYVPHQLIRLSQPIPDVNLIAWLKANPLGARYYWKNRNHTLALAALGDCLVLESDTTDDQRDIATTLLSVVSGTDAGFIGGQSFNGQTGTGQWQDYAAIRYCLPVIELRQIHAASTLYVNLFARTASDWHKQLGNVERLLKSLSFPAQGQLQTPHHAISRRSNNLDEAQWHTLVDKTLSGIRHKQVEKVVLAREVAIETDEAIDAFDLLAAWQQRTPNSFSFLYDFDGGIFLGCSPERLLSRRQDMVSTESLAGTTRRGATPEEDFRLGQLLLEDPKLCREHELVSQFVTEKIRPFVTNLTISNPAGIFKLDRIQHRYLPIKGILKPQVQDIDLLQQLHPTPAVGGFPQAQAQALIQTLESFDRGWYAGVVGVISEHNADYVVAIRSALVKNNHIQCYSGVGLVEGSIAESEWQELESKIESLLSALTGNSA